MAFKNHDFNDLVRLEQLRHIETGQAKTLSYAGVANMESYPVAGFSYAAFLERLLNRAHHLIHDNHLDDILQQPEKLFVRAGRVILVLATILGGLAAINATGDSSTLNIYWLLVVLLGFNFFSMLLWSAGITLGIQGLSSGIAAQLARWLPFLQLKKKEKDSIGTLAAHAWWETCLFGKVGKWRISLLTHQFWMIYLLAGMGTLILLMLAKQYDFVWGTTLLPENSLPELTRLLAAPMELIGLASPDSQQIAASRIGAGMQDASIRNAWAKFLVGALIVYGVLPRIILALFAFLMLKLSEYRYKLDLYLPYYVTLRQSLIANEFMASVIDRDPGVAQEQPVQVARKGHNRHLPEEALVIGIELDNHIIWPKGMVCQENVADQETLMRAVEMIKKSRYSLLIGVAAHRLPDRGVQRIIKKLTALASGQIWLVLLQNNAAIPITESRKQAWFRLAQASTIPAEHVLS
ncbi:DUF2868 domain-containing protein [Nitrosomonas eutropha]|uniref:Uncharacterized protein DUF2868 n=2 Tax=Nitrosomonas eutropha TaxID=916 RepID=A0ABX5M8E0_9PROT|nr:DUF2868 domain-containing protein [Nitrosomonas eutropha]ABI59289.1 conserved hypothetical protein [Nitrosomonas eutropha C91]PXV81076.1 uncharacterized protein DUF2868 [Nitrosomonas eutropha]SEI96980.1 Protein of unknown function [Nitrosomonas eutropha]